MKKIILLIFPILLFAQSPFESTGTQNFDLSAFDTSVTKIFELEDNEKNIKHVRCSYVCDKKKVKKSTKIADAISFYKNSSDYNFK